MQASKSQLWQESQIRSFSSWANYHLAKRNLQLNNICEDLKDGVLLINLLEIIFEDKAGKYYDPPKSRTFEIENANIALRLMKKHGVRLHNVAAEDIVDGKVTMVLGMIWSVARFSQIERGLAPVQSTPSKLLSSKQEGEGVVVPSADNPEKEVIETSQKQEDVEYKKDELVKSGLMDFVQHRTNQTPTSFTADFQDGKLLAALVYSFDPILQTLSPENIEHLTPAQRAELAISCAENRLNIPPLFEPTELAEGKVDGRSMMLYISLFQNLSAEMDREEAEIERQYQEKAKELDTMQEEQMRTQLQGVQMEDKALEALAQVAINIPPTHADLEQLPVPPSGIDYQGVIPGQQAVPTMSYPQSSNAPYQQLQSATPIPPPESSNPIPPPETTSAVHHHPPSESFPNPPLGGIYNNGCYTFGNGQYDPASADEIDQQQFTSETHRYGRKPTTFIGKMKAFGKRMVLEVDHELDKGVSVLSSNVPDTQKRFLNYFKFKFPEPLYNEFPCKFASSGQNMMIGFMYITKNYLCFTGEVQRQRLCVVLALADIVSVEKGATTFLQRYKSLPKIVRWDPSMHLNALLVTDKFGKVHRFFSFVNPWEAYEMLDRVWNEFKDRKSAAFAPPLPPKPLESGLQRRGSYPPVPPNLNLGQYAPGFSYQTVPPPVSSGQMFWGYPAAGPVSLTLYPNVNPAVPQNPQDQQNRERSHSLPNL